MQTLKYTEQQKGMPPESATEDGGQEHHTDRKTPDTKGTCCQIPPVRARSGRLYAGKRLVAATGCRWGTEGAGCAVAELTMVIRLYPFIKIH